MTEIRQDFEIEILGCRVKYKPTQEDTDLAVLIALKVMTEKLQFEKDCREMMDKTEASLKNILDQVQI